MDAREILPAATMQIVRHEIDEVQMRSDLIDLVAVLDVFFASSDSRREQKIVRLKSDSQFLIKFIVLILDETFLETNLDQGREQLLVCRPTAFSTSRIFLRTE